MNPPWFNGGWLAFDSETTAPDPTEARLVQATAAFVGPSGLGHVHEWLINPGIEIPPGATAVHGITTERARAEGMPIAQAGLEVAAVLEAAWDLGMTVIAMNTTYDMTVVSCELERAGREALKVGNILDPFVIDRGCDPYRQGSRKLDALAAHYRVKQEGAHSSAGDALCAARIVWSQARRAMERGKFEKLRKLTIEEMQVWQAKAHFDRQTSFEQYLVAQKKPEFVDKSWPLRGRTPERQTLATEILNTEVHP